MGDSAIINIIKQNGEIFITNDMIVDGCRYLTWIFVSKILAPIAAACEGLYDAAFDLVTFGTSTRVGTFIRSAGVVFTAIMMLSLMMLGITFILWHEKKPQLVINLVVLVHTTASSGYLMAQMSSAVTTGKDAILGSTSSAQTYETISNSFYDLRYIDQAVGLGNVSKPYPTRTMTKEEFNAIDINEVINPKSDGLSSDAKSILGKHLVNSIGGESLEKVSDGLTFYNSGASNGIMNGYYYRYHWETWNIILTLAGSLLLYLAMAYKVIRIEFELGVYRVLAYIEAANLNNTQKALKVLDAIKNSYIVLLMTCVMIKFYGLACSMIDGLTSASDIQRSIFKVFIALAVIDGPNLIQQLFGIDVGLKSIVGTMLAGGQAGAALVRGAGGAARAIGGIAGAMAAGAGADDKEGAAGGAAGAAQMGADRGDIKNAQERNDGAASTDSLNGGASYGSIPDMADDGGYSPQPSENNPLFGGIPDTDKSGDGNGSSTDGSSGGSGGAGGSGGKSGGRPGIGTSGKPSTGGTSGPGKPAADVQPPAGPSGSGAGGTEPGTGPQPLNGAPGDEAPGYAGADDRGLTGNDGSANTENTAAGGTESADAGQQAALNGGPENVPLAGAEGRTEGAGNGGTAAQHSDMPGLSDESNLFKGLDGRSTGSSGGAGEAGTSGASGTGQNDINASPYMGAPGTPEALAGTGNVPGGPGTSPTGAEGSRPGQPAGSGMNSMPGGPSASDLGIPSGQNAAGASGSGKTDAPGASKHGDMSSYSGNLFDGMSGGAAGGGGDRPMPKGSAGGSDHANMPGQMGYETQAAGLGGGSAAPSSGGSSSGSGSTPAPAAPESEFSGNMFSGHGASSQDTGSGQNGGGRAGTNGTGSMGNMAAPEPGRETYKGGSNGQTQGPGTSPERRENVSRDDRKNLGSGQKPGTETREKADGTGRKSGGRAGTNSSMNNMAAPDPERADYKQGNQERTGGKGGRKDLTTPPGSKKETGGQKGGNKK